MRRTSERKKVIAALDLHVVVAGMDLREGKRCGITGSPWIVVTMLDLREGKEGGGVEDSIVE